MREVDNIMKRGGFLDDVVPSSERVETLYYYLVHVRRHKFKYLACVVVAYVYSLLRGKMEYSSFSPFSSDTSLTVLSVG